MITDNSEEIDQLLRQMLELDVDITARELARRHPTLKSASSFTRLPGRRAALLRYQEEQRRIRSISQRVQHRSRASVSTDIAARDARIEALEREVQVLVASHMAMIRAVGEIGGFAAWAKLFEGFEDARETLVRLNAMPTNNITMLAERGESTHLQKRR
ncbi:hypothetical protein HY57_13210 [Dyella japonica A8]|uniref:Uncharacterized protein n=1 Tax=Dyella japonica A8 TaxID=1217721 RepID=A0A075K2L5_9GAMM|nr:hypothetical protein HY57_13210 [Dyella japonica A8]